jgi:predicted transcriptional regulator
MSKRRSRIEIVFSILKIIRDKGNSIKKTPLLRYSNLSSQSFKDYYDEVLAKELIREFTDKRGRMRISLTDKGFLFLQKYTSIKLFIEEFEL